MRFMSFFHEKLRCLEAKARLCAKPEETFTNFLSGRPVSMIPFVATQVVAPV
jgi:hypothetical protein